MKIDPKKFEMERINRGCWYQYEYEMQKQEAKLANPLSEVIEKITLTEPKNIPMPHSTKSKNESVSRLLESSKNESVSRLLESWRSNYYHS